MPNGTAYYGTKTLVKGTMPRLTTDSQYTNTLTLPDAEGNQYVILSTDGTGNVWYSKNIKYPFNQLLVDLSSPVFAYIIKY